MYTVNNSIKMLILDTWYNKFHYNIGEYDRQRRIQEIKRKLIQKRRERRGLQHGCGVYYFFPFYLFKQFELLYIELFCSTVYKQIEYQYRFHLQYYSIMLCFKLRFYNFLCMNVIFYNFSQYKGLTKAQCMNRGKNVLFPQFFNEWLSFVIEYRTMFSYPH